MSPTFDVNAPPDSCEEVGAQEKLGARRGIQTVGRVSQLLREIAVHNQRGLSSTEVAQMLRLNYPTAHRLLQSLVTEGLLHKKTKTKCYVLGHMAYELGLTAQWHYELQSSFRPTLLAIAQKTGQTTFLVVRSGSDTVCIDRIQGKNPGGLPRVVGSRRPLGVGVSSISMLSLLTDQEVQEIITQNSGRFLSYDELDPRQLQLDIKQCRKWGYSVRQRAISRATALSVAIPSFGPQEQTVAIAICTFNGPMETRVQRETGALLKDAISSVEHVAHPRI